jgi:hypothetical protein
LSQPSSAAKALSSKFGRDSTKTFITANYEELEKRKRTALPTEPQA